MENGSESGWRRGLRLALILGGFGGYAFAISRGIDVLDKFNFGDDFQKKFAIYYIIGLSVLILVFLVVRFYMSDRKEKFANITPRLHSVVSCCKDLHSDLNARSFAGKTPTKAERDQVIKDSQRRLREICDGAAHIFGMLTSTHCRASIKVITSDTDKRPYVLTLARDSATHQLHPFLDRNRYEGKIDPLDQNSQFLILADDKNPTYQFFSNNLLREKHFKSTSVDGYKLKNERRRTPLERMIREDPWLLPYRSTITVALRNSTEGLAPDQPSVVGFLAIDSESRGVFSRRWDPHICLLIADALFHPVNSLLAMAPEDRF